MDLSQLAQLQHDFDDQHESAFPWDKHISADNLDMLMFLLLGLAGEVGEACNLVKKTIRDKEIAPFSEMKNSLAQECADILIYTLKVANQVGFDLESEFLSKLEKNRQRFERYKAKRKEG